MTVGVRASAVRVALIGAMAVVTLGCGTAAPAAPAAPAPSVVRAPEADASAVPDAPDAKPVLTITGRIAATNVAGGLSLDLAQLDRLGLLAVSVNDPWAKRRISVQGVWLRDLVALARPDAAATSLHLTALDDYQVDFSLADVRDQSIFLATRTGDGAALPVEEGGPTRIVFTDDLAAKYSPDLWIWNIEMIDVR
jgi:hypothetical protein